MENFDLDNELQKYQPSLFKYAVSLTHDRDNALDIIQDANYLILKNRDKFESQQYSLKVSFTIIKNRFISLLRAENIHRDKVIYLEPEEQYDIENEDYISIYHDYDYILNIINRFDKQSNILIGLLIQGKSYKEISKILGIKEGTVKSRIHNIRKRLKELLPEFFEDK
ncbi:RNA polymerase sigma factor [Coprobacter sp.]